MSFYSSNFGRRVPGCITGNPCDGLCERVCIETFKVFDSVIIQRQLVDQTVTIENLSIVPVEPLTLVLGESVGGTAVIQNISIVRFNDRPNFARVAGDAVVPIKVNFIDANGTSGYGFSSLIVPFDVIMHVPQDSLVPVEVTASANLVSNIGEYVGNNTFNLTICLNLILHVGCKAQILVPSYGYCLIPKAVEYNENICAGFFGLPLYPSQNTSQTN